MSYEVVKCKILSDKAAQLLSSISNMHDESPRLCAEDPKTFILSEENIVFKTCITWLVKISQQKLRQPYIQSSSVKINFLDINYLWFRLYPEGKTSSEFLDFSIHFKHLPEKIYIVCEVALIDCFRTVLFEEVFSGDAENVTGNKIQFLNFCSRDKIKDPEVVGELEEKLTIQCRIKLISRAHTCVSEKYTCTMKMVSEISNINNDILKNGKYSDVTLLAESKQVKSHKFLLASESPILHILLKVNHGDLLELEEKYHSLQKLLKFMYTRKFRIFSLSDAVELYSTSYKHEVLNLKNLCTAYLIASLTEENVAYLWDLSRSHEDEYLLHACMAFVKSHDIGTPTFMKKKS